MHLTRITKWEVIITQKPALSSIRTAQCVLSSLDEAFADVAPGVVKAVYDGTVRDPVCC